MMLALALICALFSGCSDGNQKASGVLLVDGKPVTSGSIRFYPVGGGRLATASVEADGSFIVSYRKPGDGLPVGEYKVAILCEEPIKTQSVGADDPKAIEGLSGGPLKTRPLVPRIYNEIETTPLRHTVTESSQRHEITFDIPSGE